MDAFIAEKIGNLGKIVVALADENLGRIGLPADEIGESSAAGTAAEECFDGGLTDTGPM